MYGTETGVGTTALAATGAALNTGSIFLAAVGITLAGVAIYLLARKESKVKP